MTIQVTLGHSSVVVKREVFTALFEASIAATRAGYRRALQTGTVKFKALVELARIAQIPYTLFFAPLEVVDEQIRHKTEILLTGVGKNTFALNTRGSVQLFDIELILKDLLRKQELLKRHDRTLADNSVVGILKRSKGNIVDDARLLRTRLGLDLGELRAASTKEAALEVLIARYESKQILVSRSQQHYMPQLIPRRAQFSGLCVKDRKIPFIFLTGGDDDETFEPAGRKVFTLVLLGVCVAVGRFAPVTYSDQAETLIHNREYEIAEEVLMPAAEASQLTVGSLDDIKTYADTFRVTPSAFLMRARRLKLITPDQVREYLADLRQDFRNRGKQHFHQPLSTNALRKYNGAEYSRRMLAQMDAGRIPPAEICRVLFLNKLKPNQIPDFKAAL